MCSPITASASSDCASLLYLQTPTQCHFSTLTSSTILFVTLRTGGHVRSKALCTSACVGLIPVQSTLSAMLPGRIYLISSQASDQPYAKRLKRMSSSTLCPLPSTGANMTATQHQHKLENALYNSGGAKGKHHGGTRGDSLALGICSKVGVVFLGVNASILCDVLDAALKVSTITSEVKPRPCIAPKHRADM